MYRIELEPGDVGVFRSVEEIATAIKSGVITTRARIYHQASDKWLPIEFHPHYKQALEIVAGGGKSTGSSRSTSGPVVTFATPSGPRPAVKLALPQPEPVAELKPLPEPEPALEPEPVAEAAAHVEAEAHVDAEADEEEEEEADIEPEAHVEAEAEEEADIEAEEEADVEAAAEPEAEAEAADDYEPIADRVSAPFPRRVLEPEVDIESWPEAEREPAEAANPEPQVHFAPAPFEELISFSPPAESGQEPGSPAFPPAEPRPIVRPRLRMEMAGKPRRSFLVALGGMVLVFTTQMGLTVPERFGLDIRSLGLFQPASPAAPAVVLPRPVTTPVPVNPPAAKPVAAKSAAAVRSPAPASTPPAPQTSPSFGASSAFTPAALSPQPPAQPRRELPLLTKPPAADSIVAAAPAPSEIAIGVPVLPVAGKPAVAPGRMTAAALVTRYQAAYGAARAELETGLQTAGFANLFAAERLTSPAGVRAARLSAGTASAYVARYRRREGEIEQAYADSFATMSKLLEWSGDARRAWENRQVMQEKPEVAKLASFLLGQIDSLYGVLSSQEGAYDIKGGTITFQDAKAAHAYGELRPWLDRRAHQWADTAAGVPTTAARILRAIGSTKLPEGGAL